MAGAENRCGSALLIVDGFWSRGNAPNPGCIRAHSDRLPGGGTASRLGADHATAPVAIPVVDLWARGTPHPRVSASARLWLGKHPLAGNGLRTGRRRAGAAEPVQSVTVWCGRLGSANCRNQW